MIRMLRSLACDPVADRAGGRGSWVPTVERKGGVLLLLAALYLVHESAAYAGLVTPFRFPFN